MVSISNNCFHRTQRESYSPLAMVLCGERAILSLCHWVANSNRRKMNKKLFYSMNRLYSFTYIRVLFNIEARQSVFKLVLSILTNYYWHRASVQILLRLHTFFFRIDAKIFDSNRAVYIDLKVYECRYLGSFHGRLWRFVCNPHIFRIFFYWQKIFLEHR